MGTKHINLGLDIVKIIIFKIQMEDTFHDTHVKIVIDITFFIFCSNSINMV